MDQARPQLRFSPSTQQKAIAVLRFLGSRRLNQHLSPSLRRLLEAVATASQTGLSLECVKLDKLVAATSVDLEGLRHLRVDDLPSCDRSNCLDAMRPVDTIGCLESLDWIEVFQIVKAAVAANGYSHRSSPGSAAAATGGDTTRTEEVARACLRFQYNINLAEEQILLLQVRDAEDQLKVVERSLELLNALDQVVYKANCILTCLQGDPVLNMGFPPPNA